MHVTIWTHRPRVTIQQDATSIKRLRIEDESITSIIVDADDWPEFRRQMAEALGLVVPETGQTKSHGGNRGARIG